MKKFFSVIAIAAIAGVAFVSCDKDDEDAPLKGISISQKSADIIAGEKLTLTASYNPKNASPKPEIVWNSSDTTAAKVVNGVVYAKKYGKYAISATAGEFSDTCIVTIGYAEPDVNYSDIALVGIFHGRTDWGHGLRMYEFSINNELYFYIGNITLIETDKFKLCELDSEGNTDWPTFNRGSSAFQELGKPFVVGMDGDNIRPGLTGTYDIWYYYEGEKMAIIEHVGLPDRIDENCAQIKMFHSNNN